MTKKEIKVCTQCGSGKPISEFYTKHYKYNGKPYKASHCRTCESKNAGKWAENNKGRIKNTMLKRVFGVDSQWFEKTLEEQGGVCAICGETNRGRDLCVDHHHGTGKVRGLLCHKCNLKLSWFERYKKEVIDYEEAGNN